MFYFHSFACSCPVFPAPLIKETIVSPSYISPLSVQFSSVTQSCLTPCDPMDNCSKPGLPVHQ